MPTITRATAGIDWLTMTVREESDGYHEWRNTAVKCIERVADEGYQLGDRALLGYVGVSAGNCFLGDREGVTLCQITGEKADWAYPLLYNEAAHYSRIDVQITTQYDVMDANIGKKAYRDSLRANEALPAGRKRKVWIIIGSDGGDTCYIGSASSEQRARIYNKEVQSEDIAYSRCWRYEVVFRNDLATGFTRGQRLSHLSQESYCLATVDAWLSKRGVGMGLIGGMGDVVLPLARTLPTDVERKLKWLTSQVRPTIRYLCSIGFREILTEALFGEEGDTV